MLELRKKCRRLIKIKELDDSQHHSKYLKYKTKYLQLKAKLGLA
jgi:hypothetical protein